MASLVATEVSVKAVPVNGLCEFVKRELTPEQYERAVASVGPENARYLRGHMLAHEQVPLAIVNDFTTAAAHQKGEPVKQFARRAGRYGGELGLKSVYKFMMMLMSIESVLKKAPFMWSRVYDRGDIVVEPGDRTAKITVRNFPGNHAGCGRITGWFEVIGEKAGAKNLRLHHTRCMADGAPECVWDFKYD